jgi:hypothetical protein
VRQIAEDAAMPTNVLLWTDGPTPYLNAIEAAGLSGPATAGDTGSRSACVRASVPSRVQIPVGVRATRSDCLASGDHVPIRAAGNDNS